MGDGDQIPYPNVTLWLAWGETPPSSVEQEMGDTKSESESKNLWVPPCPTLALI